MRNHLEVAVLAAFLAVQVPATEQRPDYLIVDGAIYRLPVDSIYPCDQPLQQLWKDPRAELGLDIMSTGCWRGYIAIWELQNDRLYLRALDAWRKAGTDPNQRQKVSLRSIFHERIQDGRVPADWFKGRLTALPTNDASRNGILSFDKGRLVPDNEVVRTRHEDGKPIPQDPDVLLYDGTVYYLPAS